MVEVYALNIWESVEKKNLCQLIKFISSDRVKRVSNFRNREDSYRSVLGELLARYVICYKSGCLNKDIKIKFSIGKKPQLLYPDDLFFNISHSGDWVICGISESPIGVDIEHIKNNKCYLNVIERFFSAEEKNYILNNEKEINTVAKFYRLWTLKESYVKADGRGFALPLKSFSIIPDVKKISVVTDNALRKCEFRSFQLEDEYAGAICSVDGNINDVVKIVDVNNIINLLLGSDYEKG
jgi:4'-phosphopantetheinyl transferase